MSCHRIKQLIFQFIEQSLGLIFVSHFINFRICRNHSECIQCIRYRQPDLHIEFKSHKPWSLPLTSVNKSTSWSRAVFMVLITTCTNPAMSQLMDGWKERFLALLAIQHEITPTAARLAARLARHLAVAIRTALIVSRQLLRSINARAFHV